MTDRLELARHTLTMIAERCEELTRDIDAGKADDAEIRTAIHGTGLRARIALARVK